MYIIIIIIGCLQETTKNLFRAVPDPSRDWKWSRMPVSVANWKNAYNVPMVA
jgi:hypothetical protein